ncbi:MAG: V-type ATP synthase subunit E [Gammaproteobacteria bacterium]|nr:V-type ATP synthase subunit E [Gammaproteobacteria bacterium]
MSDVEKVEQLEQALLRQAESLADEQRRNAQTACARIQADGAQRLREREKTEIQAAKLEGGRRQRRLVQAAEARLAGNLDRLRWTLVQSALSEMNQRLDQLVEDKPRYLNFLESLLGDALTRLPDGPVLVRLGSRDYEALRDELEAMAARVAPGRKVRWEPLAGASDGGLQVNLVDETVRIDHTFAGRQERLAVVLAESIMERLFAAAPDLGTFVHG